MQCTLITSSIPSVVSKIFNLDENGCLTKSKTSAQIAKANFETISFENIVEFGKFIDKLKSNQCLIYGLPPNATGNLITEEAWKTLDYPDNPIPRLSRLFKWPKEAGILALDYDPPKNGERALLPAEIQAALFEAVPELINHQILWKPSTSSNIYSGNLELNGLLGQRFYIPLVLGEDIPRVGKIINKRLQGIGIFRQVENNLVKEFFDESMFQTNRIDFCAGAICKNGIRQRDVESILIADGKTLFDSSILKDVVHFEHKKSTDLEIWEHNQPLKDWTIERVREELLPSIPDYSDYENWFKVCCALSNQFNSDYEAFVLFDDYSSRDLSLYDPNAVGKAWKDVRNRPSRKNITLRWLISESKKNTPITSLAAYGDIKNGQLFKELHEGKLLFCHSRSKWLKYDGIVWNWCNSGEELEAAKEVATELAIRAAEQFKKDPSNQESKIQLSHAKSAHNTSRLEAMLRTASTENGMKIAQYSDLDSDPLLLGCLNGVINLRNGALLAPDPKLLISKQTRAHFNAEAACPLWIRFVSECLKGDEETIKYVQKALGYTLTGLVGEEVLHFAFGHGRNGKSVFANVICHLMGEYAVTAPAETLMRKDRTGASNDIAMLCGARLVLANETRSDQRFDDLTIKTLVSTEPISARFLHQEFFTYMPTFKIWIRGNHKPVIVDESEGAWRRIRLIPFENQVHPDNVDFDLERKLLSEKEGILAWMVRGCLLWQKEGLKPSRVISDHSNLYRSECDILGEFLAERCITGKTERATQKDIWGEWQSWAREYNYYSGTKKTLTRKLSDRGITNNGYIGKERAYIGLRKKETSSNFSV